MFILKYTVWYSLTMLEYYKMLQLTYCRSIVEQGISQFLIANKSESILCMKTIKWNGDTVYVARRENAIGHS